MTTALYDKGRNHFAEGDILWKASGGSTIRAFLVTSGYTPNLATDEFLSAISAGNRMGNSGSTTRGNAPQLTLSDPVAGVCDASDTTVTAVPASVAYNAVVIFRDDGSADASSQLIAYIDGIYQVEVAVDAAAHATTVYIERLPAACATVTTFTKVSGSGPSTFATSVAGSAGDNSLTVSDIGATGITHGAIYSFPATTTGLPVTSNGADIVITWDNGSNKIFKL